MKPNRSPKVNSRKLRFESLEERQVLSISPLQAEPFLEDSNFSSSENTADAFPIGTEQIAFPIGTEPIEKVEVDKIFPEREDNDTGNIEENQSVNALQKIENEESEIISNPVTDYFHVPKITWTDADFENPDTVVYTTLDTIHFLPHYPSLNDAVEDNQNEQLSNNDTYGQPSAYPSYNTSIASNYENYTRLNYVRDNYGVTGKGQTVVVIDTGIFADHIAFKNSQGGNRIIDWKDFVYSNTTPIDTGFHGTHVSGGARILMLLTGGRFSARIPS